MTVAHVIGEQSVEEAGISEERALSMYEDMVRARRFDGRAIALQRRGWMSGYPPFKGQEASQVGAAHAMGTDDWLFPTYRSNAMQFARSVPMSDVLAFRRGVPEYASDHDVPNFPQAIPIATQIPHATGAGMAADYMDGDHAILCYFGDGATSEGDFHEGLNFAGVFEAPVVFFCENNNWAISLPEKKQTASATIAQKATAYGFEGRRVDGNDPIAVYMAVSEALADARETGPVLIESLTYRHGAHTTSDDPSRYREAGEEGLLDWRTADPLDRYEAYLREQGLLDDNDVEAAREAADDEIDAAIDRAETIVKRNSDPRDLFEHVYETLPPRLRDQRAWVDSFVDEHEGTGD
jgi:pyruvate dehydrogenase E1 component alpha subunit